MRLQVAAQVMHRKLQYTPKEGRALHSVRAAVSSGAGVPPLSTGVSLSKVLHLAGNSYDRNGQDAHETGEQPALIALRRARSDALYLLVS
jgi:hypothetical protein